MSDETKDSFFGAFIVTAIVIILLIIFGNTGSGFFRNLMVFIVGSVIGTPIAMFFKWISSLLTYNALYHYGSFIFGAIIGAGLASSMFSNKLEVSYISDCFKSGFSKSVCECSYDKLDAKYGDSLEKALRNNNKEFTIFQINSLKQCKEL